MKRNIFKAVSKNELTKYAISVLLSVAFILAAVYLGKGNLTLRIVCYALSVAAANYSTAVDSIEKLFYKKFSDNLFMILGILVIFLVGGYEQAAYISIFYCFGLLLKSYFGSQNSKLYKKYDKSAPVYAVKRGNEYVGVSAGEVKVGDTVLCKTGDYICFDGVINDSAAQRKVYAGIFKEESAAVNVTAVYELEADFEKMAKLSDGLSKTESLCSAIEKAYPFVVFAIGVIYTLLLIFVKGFAGMYGIYDKSCVIMGAAVVLLSGAFTIVSGVYEANSILLAKYKSRGLTLLGSARFDELCGVKTAVINKNAVLTRGVYSVAEVFAADGYSESDILTICAAVQPDENSPYAKAFLDKLGKRPEKIGGEYIPHKGIIANVSGKTVIVGSPRLLSDNGIDLGVFSQSSVCVAVDKKAIGVVRLSDRLKGDASTLIGMLKNEGIRTVIVSADNEETTKKVAKACGADEYHALFLCDEKTKLIEELKKTDGKVMYIGDDDECLKAADVAVSVESALDFEPDKYDISVDDNGIAALGTAFSGGRRMAKLLNIRLIVGIAICAVLMLLIIMGVISKDLVFIAAIVQVVVGIIPLALVRPMIEDKESKK